MKVSPVRITEVALRRLREYVRRETKRRREAGLSGVTIGGVASEAIVRFVDAQTPRSSTGSHKL